MTVQMEEKVKSEVIKPKASAGDVARGREEVREVVVAVAGLVSPKGWGTKWLARLRSVRGSLPPTALVSFFIHQSFVYSLETAH